MVGAHMDPNDTDAAEVENPASDNNEVTEPVEFKRETLSPEQRMNVLAGKGADVFDAQKLPDAKVDDGEKPQDAVQDAETTAKEAAEAAAVKSLEDDDGKPLKMPKLRYQPKDPKELEVMSLVQQGKSFSEATTEVYGETTPAAKADEAPEAKATEAKEADEQGDPQLTQFNTDVEKAENELADLEQRLTDATEAEDIAESTKLTREIVRKEFEVENQKSARDQYSEGQVQDELNAHDTKVQESADTIYENFPTLADEESTDRAEFIEFYKGKGKDPDYADVFKSPKWPEIMAREFTVSKGILPVGAKPQESPTPPVEKKEAKKEQAARSKPAPKQTPAAKNLTSGDGHQDGSTQVSAASYQTDGKKMSLADKKALLGHTAIGI